jgi:hypothetical protein
MMTTIPFIADPSEYASLQARAADVFCLDSPGLPEQVFVEGFGNFRFIEFDVLLFREFWHALTACAENCGDQDVSVIVHEPHPETYYFANFGRYGALRFQRDATAADYKKAFLFEPEGSSADALQYVAGVISWCGTSRNWGLWGERDLGVGIAASRDPEMSWPKVQGVTWHDFDTALSNLIAPNFENDVIPTDFATKLRRNFSDRRDKS